MANFISEGLTGGIASGKSNVAEMFESEGIPVLDADKIARDLVCIGSQAFSEIVNEFGKRVLDPTGSLDRSVLGEIIFSDAGEREKLNQIMHPKIQREQKNWLEKIRKDGKFKIGVVEAALMIESGGYKNFEFLVVVKCSEKDQFDRLEKRDDFAKASIRARLESQMPMIEKTEYADWVLDNSRDLNFLKSQVSVLVSKLFSMV